MEGLYKIINNDLCLAQNKIIYPDKDPIEVKDFKNKEVDGWKWFNSRKEAVAELNYKEPELYIKEVEIENSSLHL